MVLRRSPGCRSLGHSPFPGGESCVVSGSWCLAPRSMRTWARHGLVPEITARSWQMKKKKKKDDTSGMHGKRPKHARAMSSKVIYEGSGLRLHLLQKIRQTVVCFLQ